MKDALVAIEDKRFYTHKGVDWFRTAHAALNMFTGGSTFGGSTITQQLIKNLTQQDDITVQRKLLEIFQALDFEKKYDKEEILEWYLNAVYFGEGCYGVQTAAQTYFGKDAKDLTIAEAASIVGITNLRRTTTRSTALRTTRSVRKTSCARCIIRATSTSRSMTKP